MDWAGMADANETVTVQSGPPISRRLLLELAVPWLMFEMAPNMGEKIAYLNREKL
jgi:hypothetical protein